MNAPADSYDGRESEARGLGGASEAGGRGAEARAVVAADLALGRVRRASEVAAYVCPGCRAELEDRYHLDCPECGRPGQPTASCRGCGGALSSELLAYTARGARGGSVSKHLPGVSCARCCTLAIEALELEALDALAERAEGPLELLPELGIASRERLEVLVDAAVGGAGEPEQVEARRAGMRLLLGSPSELFEAALGVVTVYDPKDIFSPTLRLEPGPPYSAAQRRTLQLLLGDVQLELGEPVVCWSASVGLSEEPLVDPVLMEQLMTWGGDPDGAALALYHATLAGHAPGRFQNSVRLLERVLGDPPAGALGAALRDRVARLERPPSGVLQQLWLAMSPGRSFDERQVYSALESFHRRQAEPRELGRGAALPWDEPNYDGYATWLRRLVSELLAAEQSAAQ